MFAQARSRAEAVAAASARSCNRALTCVPTLQSDLAVLIRRRADFVMACAIGDVPHDSAFASALDLESHRADVSCIDVSSGRP